MLDTLLVCLTVWQADRWCKDNALSLECCTKALRAGQKIHLVAGTGRLEGAGGLDVEEGERVDGGLCLCLHIHS